MVAISSNFTRCLLFFNVFSRRIFILLLFLRKYLFICSDEHGLIFLRWFVWIVLNWLSDIIYVAVERAIIKGRKWRLYLDESVILAGLRIKVLLCVFSFHQNVAILRLRKPVCLSYLLFRTTGLNIFNLDQFNGSRGLAGLNLQLRFDFDFTLFNALHFNDVLL